FTQFATASYGLVVGRIVDRRGARPVESFGECVMPFGFLLLSRDHWLPALYACVAGPGVLGSPCVGAPPVTAAVQASFVPLRGRAVGLATAGRSAGGVSFAPVAQYLIGRVRRRGAYAVLALLILVPVLPLVLGFMRRDPADLGLVPDGTPRSREHARESLAQVERELGHSLRPEEAVRRTSFWLLAVAFGITMAGLSGVLLYQSPLLVDRGMPAAQ